MEVETDGRLGRQIPGRVDRIAAGKGADGEAILGKSYIYIQFQ